MKERLGIFLLFTKVSKHLLETRTSIKLNWLQGTDFDQKESTISDFECIICSVFHDKQVQSNTTMSSLFVFYSSSFPSTKLSSKKSVHRCKPIMRVSLVLPWTPPGDSWRLKPFFVHKSPGRMPYSSITSSSRCAVRTRRFAPSSGSISHVRWRVHQRCQLALAQ